MGHARGSDGEAIGSGDPPAARGSSLALAVGTHGKTEHPNAARRKLADPHALDLEIRHALVWKHTHSNADQSRAGHLPMLPRLVRHDML